ncbi:MAG: cell division protein SepF [Oscillospiraceae bacterium]|nr:cell division protein SepF [Oscillospiraceae bacterium]
MGFFDEIKKLTRPFDEDDEDFYSEEEEVFEEAAPRKTERRPNPFADLGNRERVSTRGTYPAARPAPAQQPAAPAAPAAPKHEGKVVNLGGSQMNVVLEAPVEFEEAARIADHLRSNHSILVNMESTPKDVARRLIDFLSGVAYAQDGTIKKVSANTYIITPYNVNLSGVGADEVENSGVYF